MRKQHQATDVFPSPLWGGARGGGRCCWPTRGNNYDPPPHPSLTRGEGAGPSRCTAVRQLAKTRAGRSGHFLLEHRGKAVETFLRRDLSQHRLLDQRYAIGIDAAAPSRVSEIGAHDRERKRIDEAAQRRIVGKLRLRDDGLARRQEAQGLVVHQAWLVIEHEADELPGALLVAAGLEHRERLGEVERRTLFCRTHGQRHGREIRRSYILLLLADRAGIVLVHAGNTAPESLNN